MSSKSRRKPAKPRPGPVTAIEELQLEIGHLGNAFQLIANASHPGNKADVVLATLQFIDKKHLSAVTELKAIAPHLFDTKKDAEPETTETVIADAASATDHQSDTTSEQTA